MAVVRALAWAVVIAVAMRGCLALVQEVRRGLLVSRGVNLGAVSDCQD